MRPRASRRLTALAISAVLTLGAAAPALADEARPSGPAAHADTRAPLPDAVAQAAPADGVTDALAAVQKAVADLLASVSPSSATGLIPQLTGTLTSLVGSLVTTLTGVGLPPVQVPAKPPVDLGSLPVEPPPVR